MKDGGPAFPAVIPLEHSWDDEQGKDYPNFQEAGMTLRDYFAAQAMVAVIQRLGPLVKTTGTDAPDLLLSNPSVTAKEGLKIRLAIARAAFVYADAMLQEREK